jgi:hypothetical protein
MSRARILADYVSSGDELADKAPLASPAFTGTPTGITAAHLEAGVLPSDVTGGSGLTALGTVISGVLEDAVTYRNINQDLASTDSPTFAGMTISNAISSMVAAATANKFLFTDQYGGLGQMRSRRGSSSSTGTVNILTPSQYEFGMIMVAEKNTSTHQGLCLYSAEWPGVYALRILNVGSTSVTFGYTGANTITVNCGIAFAWASIGLTNKNV